MSAGERAPEPVENQVEAELELPRALVVGRGEVQLGVLGQVGEAVVAELILFMRATVRELGDKRATGFLKKFYGWYLGRGRFPRPFKQELVQLETLDEVETRLLAAAPEAAEVLARLEGDVPDGEDDVVLDLPISIYGGG